MFNGFDKFNPRIKFDIINTATTMVGLNVGQGSLGQIADVISIFFTTLGLQLNLLTVLIIYVVVISFSAILNRLQILMTSDIEFQFAAHLRKQLYISITNSNWLFLSKMKIIKLCPCTYQ